MFAQSRGWLLCFWVIPPWKEARSRISEKEQSLQTTGRASRLFCSLPSVCCVFCWDGLSLEDECFSAVFLDTLSSRVPPLLFFQHALWLQPTCEISTALLMREQVASHSCRAIFQGTVLTSDAWPAMEGKHQNLGCPHTLFIIPGSDRLISAVEHIGRQFCGPGSGATVFYF